jgi:hypothetical protein
VALKAVTCSPLTEKRHWATFHTEMWFTVYRFLADVKHALVVLHTRAQRTSPACASRTRRENIDRPPPTTYAFMEVYKYTSGSVCPRVRSAPASIPKRVSAFTPRAHGRITCGPMEESHEIGVADGLEVNATSGCVLASATGTRGVRLPAGTVTSVHRTPMRHERIA